MAIHENRHRVQRRCVSFNRARWLCFQINLSKEDLHMHKDRTWSHSEPSSQYLKQLMHYHFQIVSYIVKTQQFKQCQQGVQ